MKAFAAWIGGMSVTGRWTTVGALLAGVTGGIAGLVLGLFAYAPTAPFAVFEVGIPAALAGAVVGFVLGTIRKAVRLTGS